MPVTMFFQQRNFKSFNYHFVGPSVFPSIRNMSVFPKYLKKSKMEIYQILTGYRYHLNEGKGGLMGRRNGIYSL